MFKRLFSPIQIGKMTLKNRIAMAPMGTSYCTKDGNVTPMMKDFYEARARGGAGLIIVENAAIDFYRCTQSVNRLAIDNDLNLPGLRALANAIKKHGAKACIQLTHMAKQARFDLTGFQPVAPSAIIYPGDSTPANKYVMPREITVPEIHEVVQLFARAAVLAKRAGFDCVELHAAHAYIFAEFLSLNSNKRKDEYGGSLENRARLLVETLKAIREAAGEDYPVWARFNGAEYGVKDGFTLDEAKALAKMINPLSDAMHISAFGYGKYSLTTNPDTPGELIPLAAAIKKIVTVPVMGVGRLTPEYGEQAIKDGKVDIIAVARQFLADPDFPNKAQTGKIEDIRPCIACYSCHDMSRIIDKGVICAVNATVGQASGFDIKPAKKTRKIAIVGGGPAGMEAARALTLRGHKVVLFEKQGRLGGQLNLAIVPPYKRERMEPLITYYLTQLKKLNVEIRLNTAADVAIIEKQKPDAVILATGVIPLMPEFPGADPKKVFLAVDILAGKAKPGHRVVVVGGGSIGCETAEYLYAQGHDVTLVRGRSGVSELATDLGFRDRIRFLNRLTTLPIKLLADYHLGKIQKDGVIAINKANNEQFIPADTVVVSAGSRQNNVLFTPLKLKGYEVHLAGDCWRLGRIAEAVSDGLRLGCIL